MARLTINVPDDLMARLREEARRVAKEVEEVALDRLAQVGPTTIQSSAASAELTERWRQVDSFREALRAKGVLVTTEQIERDVAEGRP